MLSSFSRICSIPISPIPCFPIPRSHAVSLSMVAHPSGARKICHGSLSSLNKFKPKLIPSLHCLQLGTESFSNYTTLGDLGQLREEDPKSFKELESLQIQISSTQGGVVQRSQVVEVTGISDHAGSLMKWKAEYDPDFQRCMVLFATSFEKRNSIEFFEQDPLFFTKEVMASRGDLPKLKNLVITDSSQQGIVSMEEDELEDLRDFAKDMTTETLLKRDPIPDCKMKCWCLPKLEFPVSGYVMKGATLFEIWPAGEELSEEKIDGCDFDGEESEKEFFGTAVKEILKSGGSHEADLPANQLFTKTTSQ
ncbi:putative F-box family protein [Quillaja saponaria]|uniref:F-box family protein n=1 Tax=Quillaja saponaria TaxID=32244 RepID=A0AAD7LM71_QUISA|nr:putative F-box family protein [Quillaja saponaria]